MKRKYIRPAMGAVRMELTSIINGSQDGWEVIPPDGPNPPAGAPLLRAIWDDDGDDGGEE